MMFSIWDRWALTFIMFKFYPLVLAWFESLLEIVPYYPVNTVNDLVSY